MIYDTMHRDICLVYSLSYLTFVIFVTAVFKPVCQVRQKVHEFATKNASRQNSVGVLDALLWHLMSLA